MTRSHWPLLVCLLTASLSGPGRARDNLPPVPQGVEVQARGPIHEAFASLTADAVETKAVPKKPPAAIEEMPPEQKPEGDVIWIGGYWAWDDDRSDFLWVTGTWRVPPPNKQWVSGYWREEGTNWQWVAGFWAAAKAEAGAAARGADDEQQMTYLPSPPATPQTADPGKPPADDTFYVPGSWVWSGTAYAWRAGYWARVQPGYVWVSDHFRWTPAGYVYVAGYWDLALKNRGILYAPVVIRPDVVTVGFVYTPTYAVRDTVIVDSMFVRPTVSHYYFGDYYGPRYTALGYESSVVYSQRRYDSIIVYERYERRRDPAWLSIQINTYNDRYHGRAELPPRTIVQNNTTIINNNITIAPVTQVAMTKNVTMVNVDNNTRVQARAQASAMQQVSTQRAQAEVKAPAGAPRQARVASLNVPKAQPVKPGMVAAKPAAAKPVAPARPAPTTPAPKPPVARVERAGAKPPPATTQPKPGQPARPGPAATPSGSKWAPATPVARPGQPPPKPGQPATAAPPRPQAQPTRQQPARKPPPRDEKKKERDR